MKCFLCMHLNLIDVLEFIDKYLVNRTVVAFHLDI